MSNLSEFGPNRDAPRRCSECEERDASRLCDYCGDKFCAQCWPVVHDAGRQHHTYITVNKPECSHCMSQFAVLTQRPFLNFLNFKFASMASARRHATVTPSMWL